MPRVAFPLTDLIRQDNHAALDVWHNNWVLKTTMGGTPLRNVHISDVFFRWNGSSTYDGDAFVRVYLGASQLEAPLYYTGTERTWNGVHLTGFTDNDFSALGNVLIHGYRLNGNGYWRISTVPAYLDVTFEWLNSTLSVDKTTLHAGETLTATASVYDASYTHALDVTMGSESLHYDMAVGVTTQSVTIPMEWLAQMPGTQAMACNVKLSTYSGGTLLGESSKTVTVTAPPSSAPTFVHSVSNPQGGIYVQGQRRVQCELTGATAQYGATIVSTSINVGGITSPEYNATGTADLSLLSPVLTTAGQIPITFTVTDSRGLSATNTATIEVLEYSPPIADITLWRCDADGTPNVVGVRYGYSYTTQHSDLGGTNPLACAMAWRKKGTTAWTDATNTGTEGVLDTGDLDLQSQYEVRLTVTDNYASVGFVEVGASAAFVRHVDRKKNSIAFGKHAEHNNSFEIAPDLDVRMMGGRLVDIIYPVGSIYMSVVDVSPASLIGGTWERIEGKFLLGASAEYAVGTEGGEAEHTLTVDELPSHTHDMSFETPVANWQYQAGSDVFAPNTTTFSKAASRTSTATGSGAAHDNMPPYLAVYMWKRVS